MEYVAVRHAPGQQKVFWFQVPESLKHLVKVGSRVLCDTRMGKCYGTVLSVLDGIGDSEAEKIIGPHFPLKNIIGVETTFKIGDILVPVEFVAKIPHPSKIAKRVREFRTTGKFDTKVIFYSDGTLVDGYTAYLVAKMFDQGTLSGFCV